MSQGPTVRGTRWLEEAVRAYQETRSQHGWVGDKTLWTQCKPTLGDALLRLAKDEPAQSVLRMQPMNAALQQPKARAAGDRTLAGADKLGHCRIAHSRKHG
jgi:hypothetical protein